MLYSDFEKLTEETVILYIQHEDVMIEEHEVNVSEMGYFLKFGKIEHEGFFLSDNTIFYGSAMFNVYLDFQDCLSNCIENEIEYWEDEIEIDYKKALFRVLKNSYGI